MRFKVPEVTITRLSLYLRCLSELENEGVNVVSSSELGERCGLNPAQVRKDLAYFGEFGTRGVGYYVKELKEDIKRVLGLDKEWEVALVGVGNLGKALLSYGGFKTHGFKITVAFDKVIDEEKKKAIPEGCELYNADAMVDVIKKRNIKLAIVAVNQQEVQNVVDTLVKAGVKGILNFVPARVYTSKDVVVRTVDLSIELETLTYYVNLKLSE
ncbi:MAG: redox-sensing transcriptional repressor Rex [Thermosulfidibacteraceae bacterium]